MGRGTMVSALKLSSEAELAGEMLLTDDFLRQLINVGEVDILVGLPTHNNAKTIDTVVRAIQAGILKCFPRERAAIINADGGSQDGTPELVMKASIDDVWNASKVYTLRTLHSSARSMGAARSLERPCKQSSRLRTCCAPRPVW